jgi:class 3 adenylate cyclase/tetratricopeptide (TPR) repeat protein/predicted Ser/Thr protein kinase
MWMAMTDNSSGSARRDSREPAAGGQKVVLSEDAREQLERFRRSHETLVLTIFFGDLVGSTRLQTEHGNLRAAELVQQHYALMREVLAAFDGQEIRTAGDSMLIVFAAPSEAVKFALHAQRSLRSQRQVESNLLPMRVGVHQGQVVLEMDRSGSGVADVYGLQVSTAARIMDLAEGDRILLSRAVFDDARAILNQDDFPGFASLAWRNHGPYCFKGVADSHEVCEVGEEPAVPLTPPQASAKGWPAERSAEELGWRPANGVVVPESNWSLTDKLGEGAFGEVWKAFNLNDKSYQVFKFCFKHDRLPALKREARLLKRLRKYAHPSIVEVYDVTEGERPPHYLEMEYVDGPTLRDWLAASPSMSDRLEVVAQIAEALDTVHAAGIFHRDIKPANILLTHREDGALQAKLSDFGLGAAQDPEFLKSISTSPLDGVVGTWDYIAPEVRHGAPASAQSDIYSLGLTLYQITVGDVDRPLTGDWERQLSSDILRDDIRRCVCQAPADRWPRAADLAKALRSHDERTRAAELERQREEHRRRAQHLRRAAVVAGCVAVVLLAISSFAIHQWYEAARQRDAADRLRGEAAAQRDEAARQRDEAAHQRDRAVTQKRLALEAINKLTYEVPMRLRNIAGTLPITKSILEENLGMLDRILAMEPDTPLARRERAVTLVSIGDRWMLVGDTQRALAAFEEGLSISRQLADAKPQIGEYLRDVTIGWDRLGDVRLALGQTNEALPAYQQSLEICRVLVHKSPDSRARRDLWQALDKLGRVSLKLGSTAEAATYYDEALALATQLAEESPQDAVAERDLGLCYERIGDLRMLQGRHEAARDAYVKAMQLSEKEAAARPDDPDVQRSLSVGFDKLGGVYLKLGHAAEARQAFESSLSLVESLARQEPENMQWQRDVSVGLDRLGDVCMDAGQPADALERFEAGMAIARQLATKDPANAVAQFDLVAGLSKLGNAHLELGHYSEALASFQEALDKARQLGASDPDDREVQRSVSVLQSKLGGAQLLADQTQEAAQSFRAAIETATRLAAADPNNAEAQRDVAVGWHRLMLTYEQTGDLSAWREASQRAVEEFERVRQLTGDDPASLEDLARTLAGACDGLVAFSAPAPADVATALARARQLVALDKPPAPSRLEVLAKMQYLANDAAAAVATLEIALGAVPEGPDAAATRARLAERLETYRQSLSTPTHDDHEGERP